MGRKKMDDGIRVGVWNLVFMVIRVLLAAVLLRFVYGETGWATTLALALVYINTEATDYWVSILAKRWGGGA
jgi:hypothetical protein